MTAAAEIKLQSQHSSGEILVVDDVQSNIDILRRRLSRQGFKIDQALDGEAALRRIFDARPDLVLLDWMMPKMAGIEVLKRVREVYSPSHLPIIMVTARGETKSVLTAFDFGANDYVLKPFKFEIVLARVKSHIERVQSIQALEALLAHVESNGRDPVVDTAPSQTALVRDLITARKAAEESLRAALEKAEGANRAKRAFLDNMCHELRTPLNPIIGLSSVLCADAQDEQRELARVIGKSGEHLLSTLNALIRMSELERTDPVLEKTVMGAGALVDDAIEILTYGARKNNIALERVKTDSDGAVLVDAAAIKQALINVISNAIKFSSIDGRVEIRTEREAVGKLSIIVDDEGVGIDESLLQRLGKPFERGEFSYNRVHAGVGLGLSIATKLVEAHGGDLTLENRCPQGVRATIVLPLASTELAQVNCSDHSAS